MYKIYKLDQYFTYYYLCDENMIILKWFNITRNKHISRIFNSGTMKLDFSPREGIYETPDLQEAINQLEQMRVLLSV